MTGVTLATPVKGRCFGVVWWSEKASFQALFRRHSRHSSGAILGALQALFQARFRSHSRRASGAILRALQARFRRHSGALEARFRRHSGALQAPFRRASGTLQAPLKATILQILYVVSFQDQCLIDLPICFFPMILPLIFCKISGSTQKNPQPFLL